MERRVESIRARVRLVALPVAVFVVALFLVGPVSTAAADAVPGGVQVLDPPGDVPANRVLDTRRTAPLGAHQALTVSVVGVRDWIPATASGVFANLTVIGARSSGFLTLFPAGRTRPTSSSISFDRYQSYSNQVLVKLGTGGRVAVYNGSSGSVQVLLDLTGYVVGGANPAPGATVAITPARVLDTATGNGTSRRPLRARSRIDVQLTGRGGIPSNGVAGVWIQLTVASPQRRGYLVAWPAGGSQPLASTVDFAAGQTVANEVFVPVSTSGWVSLANQSDGTIRLVGDVVGYTRSGPVAAEGGVTALAPRRVLDTLRGIGVSTGPVRPYQPITVQVAGHGGVPLEGARAVLLNVTATSAQQRGYLNVYAGRYCQPGMISRLNYAPGRDIANMIIAPLAPDGTVTIANASTGTVRVIADVSGVILGPRAPAGAVSVSNGTVTTPPSLSGDGRFVAYRDYLWDAHTGSTIAMPAVGRTYVPACDYWENPVGEGNPVLSGDGQHALYFLPETGNNSSSRMYAWNRTDGTSRFITDQELASASLTDDGDVVVYAPYTGITDFWERPTELIRWDRTTGEKQVLASVPEGQSISGVVSGDGGTVIYEVDEELDQWGPVVVYRWRDGHSERIGQGGYQAVSDDGNTVLLNTVGADGQLRDLALWSGGTLTTLAPQPADGVLSGDGRVAVWQQEESGNVDGPWGVYRKDVGHDAVRIIRYPTSDRASGFALSTDGSRLAYADASGVFLR